MAVFVKLNEILSKEFYRKTTFVSSYGFSDHRLTECSHNLRGSKHQLNELKQQ